LTCASAGSQPAEEQVTRASVCAARIANGIAVRHASGARLRSIAGRAETVSLDMWTMFGLAALALLIVGGVSATLLAQRADRLQGSHGTGGDHHI
jgi:hypothetical protein